jgi:ATP-dependent exoDNAse (exonuclease V) beta subunit
MLVGDPMQSIYRFRQADCTIFFHTQKYGLGPLKLEPLVLKKNFRSNRHLIDFSNGLFKDMMHGFNASTATQSYDDALCRQGITLCIAQNKYDEALQIAKVCTDIIKNHKSDPKSIAVLVQSRNQLAHIERALMENGLAYSAPGVRSLKDVQVGYDLLTLCGLWQIENTNTWLAFLRSPWIALSMQSLYEVSHLHKKIKHQFFNLYTPTLSNWGAMKKDSCKH